MEYTELEAKRLIAQLYIGLYGRAPDPDGLAYWVDELLSGVTTYEKMNQIMASEAQEWFDLKDGLTNEQLVTELYWNLFERAPDEEGLAYWVNELDQGLTTVDRIVLVMISAASPADRTVLDYKIEAALYYTDNFEDAYGRDWVYPADTGSAQAAVDGVYDRETTDASKAAVDAAANEFGTTWQLEVGADDINGSQAGDLIQGTLGGGFDAPTLDEFDNIDGGLGTDRLAIAVKGLVSQIPSFVAVENVEDVVFSLAQDSELDVDITDFDGVEHVRVTGDRSSDISLVSAVSGSVTVGDFDDGRGVGGSVFVSDTTAADFSLAAEGSVDLRGGDMNTVDVMAGGSVDLRGGDMNTVDVMAGEDAYIGGVSATSLTVDAVGYVDVELSGSAGSIDVESLASGVSIYVSDSVTSADVVAASGEDADVIVGGNAGTVDLVSGADGLVIVGGNAGTVDLLSGREGLVEVLGSVDGLTMDVGGAFSGGSALVSVGSDAGTVDVTAYSSISMVIGGNVDDLSLNTTGNIGSLIFASAGGDATLVDVDSSGNVNMVVGGSVSDAEVDGWEVDIFINGDVTDELDVLAGGDGYVEISGSAESVSIGAGTENGGRSATLSVSEDLTTATLISGSAIYVDVGGDIDTVTATTRQDSLSEFEQVGIYAGGDIGVANVVAEAVDIVANSVSDANITLDHADGEVDLTVATTGGGIGDVDVDVVGSVGYADITLRAGENLGEELRVTDTNDVGPVDIDLAGNTALQLNIEAQNSINGDVSVSWTTDAAIDTDAVINLHSNSADALSLSLSAESDSYVFADISVSGTNSDGESMASPESLALSVGGSDAYFSIEIDGNYEGNGFEGETQSLSTVSLTGDADATVSLEDISNTLEQFNGGQATGNLLVYAYVEHGSDGDAPIEQVGILTGSGSDAVFVDGEDAGSGEYHSNLLISTQGGDDYVINNLYGETFAYVGDIDVNLGDGDDEAFIVTSDATVAIDGGAGSDDIYVSAHVIQSGSDDEWTGEITLDIDAGTGDDRVDVRAEDAMREGSTIALGSDGENTLAYRYTPNDDGTWTDADTEAFDITMGGNVTGAAHTLELHTDIEVGSDVTLDIAGLGPVSVLRTQDIDYASDSQGALLTIEGGASDFLVTAGNDSPFPDGNVGDSQDDIGAIDNYWWRVSQDIQHLSTPGVVNLTVEAADNAGVALDGANNSDMESITVRAEDSVDVALTGFSDGFDVDAYAEEDDLTVALIGGGHYGSVVAAADEVIGVVISGYDLDAGYGTEGAAYTTSVESIRVDSTDGDYEGKVRIDGGSANYSGLGVGHVTIGSITIEADIDSVVQIQEFSDGSTVEIGSVLIGNFDGQGGYDSNSLDNDESGYFEVEDNEGAAIEIGSLTVDFVASSDAGTDSNFDINITDNLDSSISIGSIDVSYAHVDVSEERPDHDVGLNVVENEATSTGADMSVDIGPVDIEVGGADSDIRVNIDRNQDDWAGGMVEISVGETNLTASDDVFISIEDNLGESDTLDGRVEIEAAGLQVEVGDLTINAGGAVTDDGRTTVELSVDRNEAVHVQMGDVDINLLNSQGDFTDAVAYVTDSVIGNTESVVTRGDTTITIDGGLTDGGTSFTEWELNITDNDGSWVELGDYSVTLNAASDEAVTTDWDLDIEDNDSTEVVIGDVSLTANVSDTDSSPVAFTVEGGVDMDVDIDGNSDADITLGNVSMAMVTESDAAYGDATFDVDSNVNSTVTVGAVSMTGFDNTELVIDVNDNTTVTISDVTMSGIAEVLIDNNSDSTINVGNITSVGTSDDAPSNAWHGFWVSDNVNTNITVSDVSLTGNVGTDGFFGFVGNSDTSLEMGTLDLEAGADLYFGINSNDAGTNTVSMSDVTLTAGEDIIASITDNTNADVDIGDMTLTAQDGVSIWFYGNSDTTIDVGNITATASDGAAEVDAYGTLRTTVTTSDVTLMAGEDASIEFVFNTDSTIAMGDVDLTAGVDASIWVTDNEGTTITMGDVDLTAGEEASIFFSANSDSTITMSDVDLTAGTGTDASITIYDNFGGTNTVTMGNVTMDASDDAFFEVTYNGDVSVTVDNVTMDASDDATFAVTDNDGISVTALDVDMSADDDASFFIYANDSDSVISIGNITIEASDFVNVDIFGIDDDTGEDVDVSVGNLTISGLTDGANGVDVVTTDVDGLGSISISGDGFNFISLNLNSSTDDYIETTTIDMGGISSTNGTVVVDLDEGRISDDQTITFGDFGTATVNTLIDDGATDGGIQGVTQTYVFEGSDIGDITINGFVAGDGGSRNDVTTSDELYNTDRLDLSAFITDTDQLNFEFSDADDSVIITAKNGEFDGEIVVTGVGVDDDASTDQDIIDRVVDSIITG